MRLHKTGHIIADTVSDLIGDLPDGDYRAVYGILRHGEFSGRKWFEFDKGFWDASHFDGNYRISFLSTQPAYHDTAPTKPHGLTLEPWREDGEWTMICPPTGYVCEFFKVDPTEWLFNAIQQAKKFHEPYMLRDKSTTVPINWDRVRRVITFNSTVGIEALRRGIPVISDSNHSSIGSYLHSINKYSSSKAMEIDGYDRDPLFYFLSAHQFKLSDKEAITCLIEYYLSTSAGTHARL